MSLGYEWMMFSGSGEITSGKLIPLGHRTTSVNGITPGLLMDMTPVAGS
jgi:hypothetical protein